MSTQRYCRCHTFTSHVNPNKLDSTSKNILLQGNSEGIACRCAYPFSPPDFESNQSEHLKPSQRLAPQIQNGISYRGLMEGKNASLESLRRLNPNQSRSDVASFPRLFLSPRCSSTAPKSPRLFSAPPHPCLLFVSRSLVFLTLASFSSRTWQRERAMTVQPLSLE